MCAVGQRARLLLGLGVTLSVRDCLRIMRLRWITLVVTAVVVTGLGTGVAVALSRADAPPTSTARMLVMGELAEKEYYSVDTQVAAGDLARALADELTTTSTLIEIRDAVGIKASVSKMRSMVQVEVTQGVAILTVTVTDPAGRSQQIAAAALKIASATLADIAADRFSGEAGVSARVLTEPTLQEGESQPVLPVIAFATILGVAIGVTAAFVKHASDRYIRDLQDIRLALPDGAVVMDARTDLGVRHLRSLLQRVDSAPTVAVTGAGVDHTEVSDIASEVAIGLAAAGAPVVLVASDVSAERVSAPEISTAAHSGVVSPRSLPPLPREVDDFLSPTVLESIEDQARGAGVAVVVALPSLEQGASAVLAASTLSCTVVLVRRGSTRKQHLGDIVADLATTAVRPVIIAVR